VDDLNDPKVRPFSRAIGQQLGLEPKFIDFVFSPHHHDFFRYRVESVGESWTAIIPPDVSAAYPLWSSNGEQTLVCVNGEGLWFGLGWHDGSDDPEYLSKSVQGLLARLFIDGVDPSAPLLEYEAAAETCGFRYLSDVVSFLRASAGHDGAFQEKIWHFINEIDGRSVGA